MEMFGQFTIKGVSTDGNCLFQNLAPFVDHDGSQNTAPQERRREVYVSKLE
jgi:hypothetical protein